VLYEERQKIIQSLSGAVSGGIHVDLPASQRVGGIVVFSIRTITLPLPIGQACGSGTSTAGLLSSDGTVCGYLLIVLSAGKFLSASGNDTQAVTLLLYKLN